jgi:hypothetical protein
VAGQQEALDINLVTGESVYRSSKGTFVFDHPSLKCHQARGILAKHSSLAKQRAAWPVSSSFWVLPTAAKAFSESLKIRQNFLILLRSSL